MYSLRRRLLLTATVLLLLFLGGMTYALNRAFEDSVLSNAEDNLRNQILLLIANIDIIDDELVVPSALPEPRFGQLDSSLFAQISTVSSNIVSSDSVRLESGSASLNGMSILWKSPSLLDLSLPDLSAGIGEFSFNRTVSWPDRPSSYATSLTLEWETESGTIPLTVVVLEHSSNYTKRLRRYQRQVGLGLLLLGGLLIALLLALLGWALNPLRRVTQQVGQIEAGDRQRFDEDYPIEVSRLTQNLNQLLAFDEQRVTRQREVLGNLAHSLKTPIAVLKGVKYSDSVSKDVYHQLDSMQAIIDYQLQSASTVGRQRFAKPIEVKPLSEQIVSTLQKLHAEKGIECNFDIPPETVFYGDEGDWMELCGNLLDNAFKWASSRVNIKAFNTDSSNDSRRRPIKLMVEDDGVGIADDLKQTIAQRGIRLDSQTPGHGLGMHIVKGLVDAYDGELMVSDSELVNAKQNQNSDANTFGARISVLLR